jgi:hypothetical protein
MKEFIIGVILSIITFFAPAATIILVVLGFVLADTVTAYCRVKKQGKEGMNVRWTSRAFIKGFAPKIILYTSAILLFYGLDVVLLNQFVSFFIQIPHFTTKIISLGLIYGEIKSMDENWKVIFGKGLIKYVMDMINFTKSVKNKLEDVNKEKNENS